MIEKWVKFADLNELHKRLNKGVEMSTYTTYAKRTIEWFNPAERLPEIREGHAGVKVWAIIRAKYNGHAFHQDAFFSDDGWMTTFDLPIETAGGTVLLWAYKPDISELLG